MKEARSRYFFVYVLLAVAVSFLMVNSFPKREGVFPLDDSYIHLVYAENIARGHGFSFNRGEASMGTSSPLFVLLGSLFIRLGLDYYRCFLIASTLLFTGSSLLVLFILRLLLHRSFHQMPSGYRDLIACMGALLFSTNGNFVWYVLAGMETTLFIFLGLMGSYLYLRRGWDWVTGVILGLLLWTRVTGAILLLVLFISDICKRRFNWRGYLVTALVYAPLVPIMYTTCGSLLPTNVQAKKITYVDGDWSMARFSAFLPAIYNYLAHVTAYRIALLILMAWIVVSAISLTVKKLKHSRMVRRDEGIFIILGWGFLHLVIYGLTFRTLLHHLRYLAVIYPVIAIGCTYAIASLSAYRKHLMYLGASAMIILILISVWNANYWSGIYGMNTRHIQKVYMPAALWLRENTPPGARVAAFDIGLLKHLSRRNIIDLGGLVDEAVHPYLKCHRAGEYLKRKGADYIVYSRQPDCDLFTGIYFSEYEGDELLRQRKVASFRIDHYSMPTITHSTSLEIALVEGWTGMSDRDRAKLFLDKEPRFEHSSPRFFGDNLVFLGYNLKPDPLVLCRSMAQSLDMTYYWMTLDEIEEPFWVTTEFTDDRGETIFYKRHMPTHGRYPPTEWGKGEVIKEHHIIWTGPRWEPGQYDITISLDGGESHPAYAGSGKIVIGSLTVEDSPLKPLRLKWKKFK